MDLLLQLLVTLILLFAANVCECRLQISDGSINLSEKEGFIGVNISEKGLYYARDLLVDQALQSLVPLRIPDMKKTVKIRYILDLKATLYDASISNISVPSSEIILGKTGISIIASQVEVNLSMKWKYSYTTGVFPITVSDKGRAFVQTCVRLLLSQIVTTKASVAIATDTTVVTWKKEGARVHDVDAIAIATSMRQLYCGSDIDLSELAIVIEMVLQQMCGASDG